MNPFEGLNFIGGRLNPFSVGYRICGILDPFSGGDGVWLWLDPFGLFVSERLRRDVLDESLLERRLGNVLNVWSSNWLLWNVFDISVLDGRRLEDLDVFNGVSLGNNDLDGFLGSVVDLFEVINDNSVVIEWVGIIEVLV